MTSNQRQTNKPGVLVAVVVVGGFDNDIRVTNVVYRIYYIIGCPDEASTWVENKLEITYTLYMMMAYE